MVQFIWKKQKENFTEKQLYNYEKRQGWNIIEGEW